MAKKRTIRVFIASPGGLEFARNAFKKKVDELNSGFGDGCGVEFKALGWEDTVTSTGRRVQSEINKDVDACDVFILVLHELWGRTSKTANVRKVNKLPGLEKLSPSFTMEEFSLAMSRYEKSGAPLVYPVLRNISSERRTDPGPKLKKVLKFRRLLESSGVAMIYGWDSEKEFIDRIDTLLREAGRNPPSVGTGKGERRAAKKPVRARDEAKQLDALQAEHKQALEELAKLKEEKNAAVREAERAIEVAKGAAARAEAAENLAEARASRKAVELAEKAEKAALEGKIEEARQDFANALDGTTNPRVLFRGSEFFKRIGELDEAERLIRRCLTMSGHDQQTEDTAAANGYLGLIHWTRGNLDAAEEYHKKSLAISERLGWQEGMAMQYGNLGLIEKTRGNLKAAEEYFEKSLATNERLGRQEGMANQHGNLGVIERVRGNLNAAEEHFKKSLAINERLGRQERMASNFSNLGGIEKARGNLDAAEKYLKKSLAINELLGRQEGMAIQYGNLGTIEEARGNLDVAEEYLKKSLAINERLGRQEGMAIQYGNLGRIEKARGNLEEAKRLWTRARDLFAKVGAKLSQEQFQRLLDELG